MSFLIAAVATFIGMFVIAPIFFFIVRRFGLYAVVEERTCIV